MHRSTTNPEPLKNLSQRLKLGSVLLGEIEVWGPFGITRDAALGVEEAAGVVD